MLKSDSILVINEVTLLVALQHVVFLQNKNPAKRQDFFIILDDRFLLVNLLESLHR